MIWNRKDVPKLEYKALLKKIQSSPIAQINKAMHAVLKLDGVKISQVW